MQKVKILVVDDQLAWLELLTDILSEEGYAIKSASNFQDAVNLLKNEKFDIAILDMRLLDSSPYNIDGMRILKEAKAINCSIKVIILTGYADEKQKELTLNYYKADGYYEKAIGGEPFNIYKFKGLISELLNKGVR